MKELSEEAAAGLAAGILGTAIGFPLDVVKTRMQTHHQRISLSPRNAAAATAAHPAAAGIVQTTTNIVRREGFASLYKGMLPPLISLSILNTFSFASYSYSQQLWGAHKSTWDVRNACAAATVGPFCAVVSTLEGVVKTQLQLDNALRHNQKPHFHGSWDCIRQLTQQHGASILYTGHWINTAREIVFLVTYFFMYEGFRHELIHMGTDDEHFNKIAIPGAGGLSGALAWTASFPLDCVRAGVQGQDFSAAKATAATGASTSTVRTNAVTVLQSILRTKGFLGLYHGVAPSIARAFLVSGSRFSAYEGTLYLLRGGRDVEHHY